MHNRISRDKRCSYVVLLDEASKPSRELRELAEYLSMLGVAGCEVIVLDPAPRQEFEARERILRWVGRHLSMRFDEPSQPAAAVASYENVIVATEDVRYTPAAIGQICDHLLHHEVVEPQDYLDPRSWWTRIEASRILVHRAIESRPDPAATFAFRRDVVRSLRVLTRFGRHQNPVRRLAAAGAGVHASEVFVRREPAGLTRWLAQRPGIAGNEFTLPVKTAFFFSLLPLLVLLAIAGGVQLAARVAAIFAFSVTALALRGRKGASAYFPLHASLFAPLWLFERSVSVYWALFRKLRGRDLVPVHEELPSTGVVSTNARHG